MTQRSRSCALRAGSRPHDRASQSPRTEGVPMDAGREGLRCPTRSMGTGIPAPMTAAACGPRGSSSASAASSPSAVVPVVRPAAAAPGWLASEIPAGQGRLVELARALARGPNLLLLDEPSSGLDAAESAEFAQLLVRLVEDRDLGILMVEHDMSLVLTICQWIHVLDFGKPLMDGTPDQVRTSEEVRAAYLGQEGAA